MKSDVSEQDASSPAKTSRRVLYLIVALVVSVGYLLDLLTKQAAITRLDPNDPPVLLGGWLILKLYRNPGAAFGMGENFTIVISVFALCALIAVCVYALPRIKTKLHAVTVGLLIVGIAGNLTDRLFREPGPFRGEVIDMLFVPHFSVFNVADICITMAAGLMILIAFRSDK